ncbi:MAG: HPr family phosphocarrier protein [Lachnospiraceae bacterium]|nr:HPr family phosphocarrier protein [Lachnospiraceae bacterium]
MSVHKIRLRTSEVRDFVARASACDFDIDVSYNHLTVDAKSILGVLALDLRQILTVSCNGYSSEFESYLMSKFALAS